jgi:hypothetical protein
MSAWTDGVALFEDWPERSVLLWDGVTTIVVVAASIALTRHTVTWPQRRRGFR